MSEDQGQSKDRRNQLVAKGPEEEVWDVLQGPDSGYQDLKLVFKGPRELPVQGGGGDVAWPS